MLVYRYAARNNCYILWEKFVHDKVLSLEERMSQISFIYLMLIGLTFYAPVEPVSIFMR